MHSPRIVYVPRPEVTSESELSVLANVYAYLIKLHDSKKDPGLAQLETSKVKDSVRGRRLR